MAKSRTNRKVDFFFNQAEKWHAEYQKLRSIILDSALTEELKWGCPCYTFQDANVVLIHGFKEYCAVLFIKGALLKDASRVLIQQTKNVQAGRQIRFTSVEEIVRLEPILRTYLHEAIEVEKTGLKVNYRKTSDFQIPREFQSQLDRMPALREAFYSLTPGRQRQYLFYFSQPKLSSTRAARVEKSIDPILAGLGLNDR